MIEMSLPLDIAVGYIEVTNAEVKPISASNAAGIIDAENTFVYVNKQVSVIPIAAVIDCHIDIYVLCLDDTVFLHIAYEARNTPSIALVRQTSCDFLFICEVFNN